MQETSGVQGWIDLLRSLGQALLDVLRAEAAALGVDLRRSAVHLGRGAALASGAAAVMFWTLGIAVLALIALLAIWLPVWGATLVALGVFAGAAGLLAWLAWRQLRQLTNPLADLKRRIDDHLDWWQNRLLAMPAVPVEPAGAGGTAGTVGRGTGAMGPPPAGPGAARPGSLGGAAPPRIHPDDPLEEDDL